METQQHMTQKIDNTNVRLPCKPKKSHRWLRLRSCSSAALDPLDPVASPVKRVSFWAYFYRLFYKSGERKRSLEQAGTFCAVAATRRDFVVNYK